MLTLVGGVLRPPAFSGVRNGSRHRPADPEASELKKEENEQRAPADGAAHTRGPGLGLHQGALRARSVLETALS